MPVLLILFVLTSGAVGYTLWSSSQRRKHALMGHPKPPSADPGAAVDIAWLGDDAVVKVYFQNNAYTAHVYWQQALIGQAGGFGSTQAAIGWGRSEARRQGANV